MADVRRRQLRYLAAAVAAAVALVYFLIGLGVIQVVNAVPEDMSMFAFGMPAGGAFLIGAALLLTLDRRLLWVLGALLQVGTLVMYVAVAPQRDPPFEVWGMLIKVGQALLLVALTVLALRQPIRVEQRVAPRAIRS